MSLIVDLLRQLNAVELSVLSLVAFLLFYTMYDKSKRKLQPTTLVRVLTVSDGVDKTLVEINKALSLSGLSVLCMAFLPLFAHVKHGLLWSAMVQLLTHAVYSFYKYYGSKNIPYATSFLQLDRESMKKLSIILGCFGQITLSAGYWNYISSSVMAVGGIVFGVGHFYTMEVDHKLILRVRPFAYVVFPLALLGIIYGAWM